VAKNIEPKRTGANASRKKEQTRDKIRTHVPRVKSGRLIIILALVGFAGYKAVQFVRSGQIGMMISPMVKAEGVVISGISTLDSLLVATTAKDSAMSITPKSRNRSLKKVVDIPGVASARLGMPFSKTTEIVVKERIPVAFVVFRGSLYFMCAEGYIWPFKSGNYWDVPVLSGVTCSVLKNGVRRISDADMKRYQSILETFKDSKEIRPVGFDFSNPDRISVRINGITPTIRFGNEPTNRLENMNGILAIVRRDDVEVRHYIDLSYKNVAFIR